MRSRPLNVLEGSIVPSLPGERNGPGSRKRQQQRSARTRDQLLRAAERVFVRDGYEKAALEEIARVAGNSRGAIYSHLKDKEDLFLSLIAECASLHEPHIRELVAEMNRGEGVSPSLHQCIGHIVDNSDLVILLMEFQLTPFATRRFRIVRPTCRCSVRAHVKQVTKRTQLR